MLLPQGFQNKVRQAERTASRKKEKCSAVLVVDEKVMSSKVNWNDMGIGWVLKSVGVGRGLEVINGGGGSCRTVYRTALWKCYVADKVCISH